MYIIGIILSTFATVATFLPFLKIKKWYIRGFEFPRLQILALSMVAILVLLFSEKSGLLLFIPLGACLICAVLQSLFILPYTPFWKKEVKTSKSCNEPNCFSLLICNVYLNNKKNPSCIEKACAINADLLFFVETDQWWENHLQVLEKDYPYIVKYPLDNTYGMLLYSKLELLDPQVKFLIKDEVPSIHTKMLLPSGKVVELRLVHPEPPAPGEAATSKARDAELVLVGKEVKNLRRPVVVGGDLNDVAWSHTTRLFQRISRLLDPRKGRGLFNTFHAKYPLLRWPLDHIFFSSHFSLVTLQTLGYTGSDHFPVFVKLHLDNDGELNTPPSSDQDDHEEADDIIEDGIEEEKEDEGKNAAD